MDNSVNEQIEHKYRSAFNYMTLRAFIGAIAFCLPILVTCAANLEPDISLGSISEYYHTDARNLFVGSLCIVGTFLFAYNGWREDGSTPIAQSALSKLAGVGAFGVAFLPTNSDEVKWLICDKCIESVEALTATLHYVSAAILFIILCVFSLYFFPRNMSGASGGAKNRKLVYLLCGGTMSFCMLAITLYKFDIITYSRTVYYAEAFALWAFGVAWFVSGKFIYGFRDD
ncbi:hypothetical protein [Aliiglaciecola sp. M165]|uniref:hypothetical protein n=1 Tax=Aliiglaciecola sp. M165 TaxID=2593649 RepID=UPI00117FE794|nr:hypothetical protein [Aliiglaciecola sp. M165]TRY29814.1 hypothetical protein FM019_16720 [Aliiglaciecola sp. M165]